MEHKIWEKGGKSEWEVAREEEKLWETIKYKKQTEIMLEVWQEGRWGNWVMGIKKGMWCDEHWVLYATDESLNTTSNTNDVLYTG